MTDLNSLAERCEKVTVPDWVLDRDIANKAHGYINGKVPPFTASIDAAMTLVPEGWHISQLGEMRYIAGERPWCALLDNWQDTETESGQRFRGQGTAPALALCAAALRTRAGGE